MCHTGSNRPPHDSKKAPSNQRYERTAPDDNSSVQIRQAVRSTSFVHCWPETVMQIQRKNPHHPIRCFDILSITIVFSEPSTAVRHE